MLDFDVVSQVSTRLLDVVLQLKHLFEQQLPGTTEVQSKPSTAQRSVAQAAEGEGIHRTDDP